MIHPHWCTKLAIIKRNMTVSLCFIVTQDNLMCIEGLSANRAVNLSHPDYRKQRINTTQEIQQFVLTPSHGTLSKLSGQKVHF